MYQEFELADPHKAIFRFVKKSEYGNWRDLVTESFGKLYHPDMKLINVHSIVFNLLVKMISEPRFEVPSSKMYEVLLTQVDDWDVKYTNPEKNFTAEEIIEGQLEKMLMIIRLSRVDWIKHQYI